MDIRKTQQELKTMESELMQVDQIRASVETIDALVEWVKSGEVPYPPLPRPLEQGLLFIGTDYVIFNRVDDMVQLAWKKDGFVFGSFVFDLQADQIENVRTAKRIKKSEEKSVVDSLFRIAFAYVGAMAFIVKNIRQEKSVVVERNGNQLIYSLNHDGVEFGEFGAVDSVIGQLDNWLGHTAAWNYH